MTNVLAVRFKGFDPERVLNRIYPYVGWFFSKPMMIFNIGLMLTALLLVSVQFDVFQSRLPSFESFFAAQELALARRDLGRHQGDSRIRPRPGVQAFWRRVPRDGRHVARPDALPLLQRLRFVDVAESLASGGDRCGRDVRRSRHRLDRHVPLVVQRTGSRSTTSA